MTKQENIKSFTVMKEEKMSERGRNEREDGGKECKGINSERGKP